MAPTIYKGIQPKLGLYDHGKRVSARVTEIIKNSWASSAYFRDN